MGGNGISLQDGNLEPRRDGRNADRSRRSGSRRAAVVAAVVFSVTAAASLPVRAAQDPGKEQRVIDDRWMFAVGGFLADFRTDASVGTGDVVGTLIRAEDLLNLSSDKSTFRLDGFWRFKPRHAVGFGYWSFKRSGTSLLTDQLVFENVTYDISAQLASDMDTALYRAYWRYAFLQNERGEAGISLGLSNYEFDLAVEGTGEIDDGMGGTTTGFYRAGRQVFAPVPTVGFFLTFGITNNIVIHLRSDYFDLQAGDLEGKLVDTEFLAEWWFTRNVGVGMGVNGTDIEVKDTGTDPYSIDYRQSGLLGFFTFAFGKAPGK